jgi:hypothetical protein
MRTIHLLVLVIMAALLVWAVVLTVRRRWRERLRIFLLASLLPFIVGFAGGLWKLWFFSTLLDFWMEHPKQIPALGPSPGWIEYVIRGICAKEVVGLIGTCVLVPVAFLGLALDTIRAKREKSRKGTAIE